MNGRTSIASRPAWTAGSASSSSRAWRSDALIAELLQVRDVLLLNPRALGSFFSGPRPPLHEHDKIVGRELVILRGRMPGAQHEDYERQRGRRPLHPHHFINS